MLSVIFLPRQFQVMVVENVNERHLKRAVWAFPLYMLLINVFVLPIAVAGLLHFGPGKVNADSFVLSLPLALDQPLLALVAFIGGLSAATGMVIVEAIAVSTMVCNDLVMPLLLRTRRFSQPYSAATSPACCWASGAPRSSRCCCSAIFTSTSLARPMRWSASA